MYNYKNIGEITEILNKARETQNKVFDLEKQLQEKVIFRFANMKRIKN